MEGSALRIVLQATADRRLRDQISADGTAEESEAVAQDRQQIRGAGDHGAIPNTPNSITHRGDSNSSQDQATVSSSFRG